MSARAVAPISAGDVVTLDELGWLRRTSGVRGAGLVLHAWATIAAAMTAYALWPSPLTLVVAVAVVGSRQLGLAVLMHETAHWLLLPGLKPNTRVGSWLCAAPIWNDLPSYRRSHHLHHRHVRGPEDPALAASAAFPVTSRRLGTQVLRDLCGWTIGARVLAWRPWRASEPMDWRRLRMPLVANAVLLGTLAATGHWWLYPLLWLLPLVTWYPLVCRLRDVADSCEK